MTERQSYSLRYPGNLAAAQARSVGSQRGEVAEGVRELDQEKLGHLLELKYHTVSDAAEELGGVPVIRDTFVGFQRYLYEG